MVILPHGLFKFQEKCIRYLLEQSLKPDGSQTIVVKAPTGSGKTVILISYMDEYLRARPRTAFIWLCPGKGDLEEQSRRRMQQICPGRVTMNLADALNGGFEPGTVTFINWELVTKKDNNALRNTERQNLFERIKQAGREGISFMAVIDEEHSNKTARADSIIRALAPLRLIRMSATTTGNGDYTFYEVEEQSVIEEGLITRAVCVNEGLDRQTDTGAADNRLVELADEKRRQIAAAYRHLGVNVRPLVLIQFPNGRPERVAAVEEKLAAMGYTYENGLAAKWMACDKRALPRDITDNTGLPVFLLMKQAVSVGWDCPRAKILVKLREGGSEIFQIQTVGRIRRMPERRHYGLELLDQCYVYTLDQEYKAGLLSDVIRAYEPGRQSQAGGGDMSWKADKPAADRGADGIQDRIQDRISDRELFTNVWRYYAENQGLTVEMARRTKIWMKERWGASGHSNSVSPDSARSDNAMLGDIVDELKTILEAKAGSVRAGTIKSILERLFRDKGDRTQKLLELETEAFYAFIICNRKRLVRDFHRIADTGRGKS